MVKKTIPWLKLQMYRGECIAIDNFIAAPLSQQGCQKVIPRDERLLLGVLTYYLVSGVALINALIMSSFF